MCYSSDDEYDMDWRQKMVWKPYEENRKEKEEKLWQQGQGFYQKEPSMQEHKPYFEAILSRFTNASEKRHSNTKFALRDDQASILNIENQYGQLSWLIHDATRNQTQRRM